MLLGSSFQELLVRTGVYEVGFIAFNSLQVYRVIRAFNQKVLLVRRRTCISLRRVVVSLIPCAYLQDTASKSCPVVVILCFSLVCTAWVWIRRKTRKWATAADAEAFLANRCWRQLHPRRAKYVRSIRRWAIWLPSIFAAFVLFFLPAASHLLYLGRSIFPHYRVSIPLNWMVIEYQGSGWLLFSEQGAARHGLTPIWFNRRMPSGVVFLIRDPEHADVWSRPESELANGHTTHLGVRDFRLGMLTSRCYEYRHIYGNAPESSSGILTPPVLWESLCATDPNGINYNLRIAFFGHREDLPTFYKVLNSATTSPNAEIGKIRPSTQSELSSSESRLPGRYERSEPTPNLESQTGLRWRVNPFRGPPAVKVGPIINATNIRYLDITSERAVPEQPNHVDLFDRQVEFHGERRIADKRAVRPMALN